MSASSKLGESGELGYAATDGIAVITFNRPDTRNATNPEMLRALMDALHDAATNPDVKVLVFRGAGEHFSSGGDVTTFTSALDLPPPERRQIFENRLHAVAPLYLRLAQFDKPMISATRGAVAGAAISIVLASDFVICGESSTFVFAHAALGLCLDGGLSFFLPRVVGERKAKQLALLGARLSAADAANVGIATEVVPDDAVETTWTTLARKLALGPTHAYAASKRLLNGSSRNGISAQLTEEALAVGKQAATEEFAEGVRAFIAKRKATFRST